jgi:hypothetical protein
VSVASLFGLFEPSIYGEETRNWALQAKGQDIGNLIAVVVLMVSGFRHVNGSYAAGLVWLGTLFYFVYAYLVYSVAVHFNTLFLVYVAVLGLSVYALLFTTGELRAQAETFPEARRSAGYTLIAIGALFGLLWLSEVVPALVTGEVPPSLVEAGLWVNPIHVIDLSVVLPGFVLAGYLTLKGKHNGLFFAGPWLVFSVLMGSSIVAAMILMMAEGFANTVPPMVMVSAVVAASLYAAWRYLRQVDR